jgi:very-short-patch-repair endonuclease
VPDANIIRKLFGSFINLEIESGKKFLPNYKREYIVSGEHEDEILDIVEKENNIKLERRYKIIVGRKKYFVDGYDRAHNIIYEVDENYHKSQKYKDMEREILIVKQIGCTFIRIDEEEFLRVHNIEQKELVKWK